MPDPAHARSRSRARRLAAQGMYQHLLCGDDADEVVRQFTSERNLGRADREYFSGLVTDTCAQREALEALLDPMLDRPIVQLDPVEHAILLLGMMELRDRADVPFRVVIDEAVELARMFGADQSYKYVNAVLDKAARSLRPSEVEA